MNHDIENALFIAIDANRHAEETFSIEQCQTLTFNDIYVAILKKLQNDGMIPICGED